MLTQNTIEYLSRLLNKPLTMETEVALSSAQKSRVHGWLTSNNIIFNEALLSSKFCVKQLLGHKDQDARISFNSQGMDMGSSQVVFGENQIGIDIQQVKELFPDGLPFDPKSDLELSRIFTVKELSYAQTKVKPEVTLTGIFSAKEAIQKTLNIKKDLNEIEVLPNELGRPFVTGFSISISHSNEYAIAICIKDKNTSSGTTHVEHESYFPEPRKNYALKLRVFDIAILVLIFAIFMIR